MFLHSVYGHRLVKYRSSWTSFYVGVFRVHFTFTSPIQPSSGYSCNIGGEVEESGEVSHFSNDKFCYLQEYAQSSVSWQKYFINFIISQSKWFVSK